jgi:hypothetical protein
MCDALGLLASILRGFFGLCWIVCLVPEKRRRASVPAVLPRRKAVALAASRQSAQAEKPFSLPAPAARRRALWSQSVLHAEKHSLSDEARKKPDLPTCKERPTTNKPRGAGGGSSRAFIPWCR